MSPQRCIASYWPRHLLVVIWKQLIAKRITFRIYVTSCGLTLRKRARSTKVLLSCSQLIGCGALAVFMFEILYPCAFRGGRGEVLIGNEMFNGLVQLSSLKESRSKAYLFIYLFIFGFCQQKPFMNLIALKLGKLFCA